MKKCIVILLLVFSGSGFADTYFCVAEAAAGVLDDPKEGLLHRNYNVESEKWIITDENGKRVVKKFGQEFVYFDSCTGFQCERSDGWAGFFHFLEQDGKYVAGTMGKNLAYTVQIGRCSKI